MKRLTQKPSAKIVLIALLSTVVGVGLGALTTWREFRSELLPSKAFLTVLAQRRKDLVEGIRGPRVVVVNGATHDFGRMDAGSTGKWDFVIRNDGDEPLQLVQGHTSCKCTSSLLDGDTLAPGKEAKIHLTWQVKAFEENFSQSAEFRTNDPHRPLLRLAIVGKIAQSLRPSATELRFHNVPFTESRTGVVQFLTHRTDDLRIAVHRWHEPDKAANFTVHWEKVPPDKLTGESDVKSGVVVLVTIKSGMPLGTFKNTLELTTNLADVPPFELPIEGNVVGDITLLAGPETEPVLNLVRLGVIPSEAGRKRTVNILVKGPHRDTTTLEVASVQPSSLQASLGEPLRENTKVRIYPLTLEVPKDTPPAAYTDVQSANAARVTIKTTHPAIPEFVINVVYVVE